MTPDEKARRMQGMAEHPFSHSISNGDADIIAEAAAHFRALVPDANGLLPCPMCGAGGRPEIFEEIQKGMVTHRGRCVTCGLATAKKWMRIDAIAVWNRRGGVAYE